MLKQVASFVLFMCVALVSGAVTIQSSNGYTVTVSVQPVALANRNCYNGTFNYEPTMSYSVAMSQPNVSMYTLQGTMYCSNNGSWFPLPLSGGTGTVNGSTSTYYGNANCATATPQTISCNNYNLTISGPGIPQQTMNVAVAAPASANTALPIHLLSFDGRIEGNGVYLVWKTASELNNIGFNLQRSTDGVNWTSIETIGGAGTTTKTTSYEFRDRMPSSGMNYYRLEQQDADGSLSYSRIIGMRAADVAELRLSPNPVTGNSFRIEGLEQGSDWNLAVVNSASQVVYRGDMSNTLVTMPETAPGLYFARLTNKNSGETKVIRFSK